MKLHSEMSVEQFSLYFLRGRISWRDVPKNGIINFGNIISMLLFRQNQFQVELFISPWSTSSFTNHRHPDVDVIEFGLCGSSGLHVNGVEVYTKEQIDMWSQGLYKTMPIKINPTDWHYGTSNTPFSFLSIQKWLNNTPPSSVGINWEGELSSKEQGVKQAEYAMLGT